MPQIDELKNSIDELGQRTTQSKDKKLSEKYGAIVLGIQNTLEQIIKSKGIITQDEYNVLDEQVRTQKMKFLEEDAISSRNRMIYITGGVIGAIVLLFWLSSKRNKK